MKTNTYLYRLGLTAVLAIVTLLSAKAQQSDQDALYIYRNDGKFNGFFYADIQQIAFSRKDTLGIEHDDYVVQEITALDSVFRIPISAIDSVAFVTPETKYKENVVTLSSDLWDYVVESDAQTTFTLSSSIPISMVPKVGDKLALTEARPHLPHGFYGQVASLASVPKGYQVTCERVALTELFDQYVVKIAATSDDGGSSNQARRRSGYESNAIDIDLPGYEQHLALSNIGYDLSENFSFSGDGQIDYTYQPKLSLRAFLSVSWWDGINFDILTRVETETNYEANIKGTVAGQFDISMPPVLIPLGTSPILLEMKAGMGFGASGTLEYYEQWHNKSSGYAAVQYNSIAEGNSMATVSFRNLTNTHNQTLAGTVTMSAGPFVEFNLLLGSESIGEIGTRFESGLRLEASADITMEDLETQMEFQKTLLYDKLNRDGSIKMGPYGSGKVSASSMGWKTEVQMFDKYKDSHMVWDFEGGLVPKFNAVGVKYDKKKGTTTASASLARSILVGGPVGFIVYDKDGKEVDKQWYWRTYTSPQEWNKFDIEFSGLKAEEKYTIYPTFKLFGKELLASPAAQFTTTDDEELQGLVFKQFKKQTVTHEPDAEYVPITTIADGEPYEFMSVPLTVPVTDLTNLFQSNNNFEVDDQGRFSINSADGLTLSGQFADYTTGTRPQTATGTYTISTNYTDNVKTAEQVATMYQNGVANNIIALMNPMLNGTIHHELSGEFNLAWSNDEGAYVLSLSKKGTYQLDCTCYNGVSNIDIDNSMGAHPNASVTSTKQVHLSGSADVDLQIVYDLNIP